ncbi:MAG TPA: hypothetical protein VF306_16700 [Pirellulales bacterium]
METISPAARADHSQQPASVGRRPAELTAIYILALVLGAVGILTGLNQATELMGGGPRHQWAAVSPEIAQIQSIYQEMHEKIAARRAPHRAGQAMFLFAHGAVSAGLLAGAVRGLRTKGAARNGVLIAAFCGGIFFELAHLMPGIHDAQQVNQMMREEAPRMLRVLAGPAPHAGDDGIAPPTAALVRAAGQSEIIAQLAATLFNGVFYCFGLRYLTGP